jgi:hypothetical protein
MAPFNKGLLEFYGTNPGPARSQSKSPLNLPVIVTDAIIGKARVGPLDRYSTLNVIQKTLFLICWERIPPVGVYCDVFAELKQESNDRTREFIRRNSVERGTETIKFRRSGVEPRHDGNATGGGWHSRNGHDWKWKQRMAHEPIAFSAEITRWGRGRC